MKLKKNTHTLSSHNHKKIMGRGLMGDIYFSFSQINFVESLNTEIGAFWEERQWMPPGFHIKKKTPSS